jgi:hypothetical protein
MFRTRKRNWLIKRIALGFAVAAFAAPVAQASVDEGTGSQANAPQIVHKGPQGAIAGVSAEKFVVRRDGVQVVRVRPRSSSTPRVQQPSISEPRIEPRIEFIRTHPRSIGEPQVVAAGFDWKDAGIGAGVALALVLLGGGAALAARHAGREQTA